MAVPLLVRTGGFAGLFGDAHLGSTELEGGDVAPVLLGVARRLGDMATAWRSRGSLLDLCFGDGVGGLIAGEGARAAAAAQLAALGEELTVAANVLEGAQAGGNRLENAVRNALARLSRLEVGAFAVLPGGWSHANGGHAVCFVVIRDVDAEAGAEAELAELQRRRFTFVVVNTGDGLQYHTSRAVRESDAAGAGAGADAERQPKQQYRQGLALGGIPGFRLLDPSVLFLLLHLQAVPAAGNQPPVLYEVILPYLSGDAPHAAAALAAAAGRLGGFASPQRAGFCFARCVFAAVRYIADRVWGWSRPAVKRLMLAHRLAWFVPAARELGAATSAALRGAASAAPSDDAGDGSVAAPAFSDFAFALLAARQTARAAVKAAARGHLSHEALRSVEASLAAELRGLETASELLGLCVPGLDRGQAAADPAEQLLRAAAQRMRILPPSLRWSAAASAADVLVTAERKRWPRFDLLARLASPDDAASEAAFAGAPLPVAAPRPVGDMWPRGRAMAREAASWTAATARDAIREHLAACRVLAAGALGLDAAYDAPHQLFVLATVESLLHELLPIPVAAHGRHGAVGWNAQAAPRDWGPAAKAAHLRDLVDLLKVYLAATASTSPRLGGTLISALTVAAVWAHVDAVARIAASLNPAEDPLAVAMGPAGEGAHFGFALPTLLLFASGQLDPVLPACVVRTRAELGAYADAFPSAAQAPRPFCAPGRTFLETATHGNCVRPNHQETLVFSQTDRGGEGTGDAPALAFIGRVLAAAGLAKTLPPDMQGMRDTSNGNAAAKEAGDAVWSSAANVQPVLFWSAWLASGAFVEALGPFRALRDAMLLTQYAWFANKRGTFRVREASSFDVAIEAKLSIGAEDHPDWQQHDFVQAWVDVKVGGSLWNKKVRADSRA